MVEKDTRADVRAAAGTTADFMGSAIMTMFVWYAGVKPRFVIKAREQESKREIYALKDTAQAGNAQGRPDAVNE